jgi:hypothetical protein
MLRQSEFFRVTDFVAISGQLRLRGSLLLNATLTGVLAVSGGRNPGRPLEAFGRADLNHRAVRE